MFAKAAQIFINELSLRAWIHTEDNKRRTLQVKQIQVFALCGGQMKCLSLGCPIIKLYANQDFPVIQMKKLVAWVQWVLLEHSGIEAIIINEVIIPFYFIFSSTLL